MATFEFTRNGETTSKNLSGWGCFGIGLAILAVFALVIGVNLLVGYGLGYIIHLLVESQTNADVIFWPFWAVGTVISMAIFSLINRK